jgi:hypothetical protein
MRTKFWTGNLKEADYLGDFKEIISERLDCVCLPQDTEPSWGMYDHSKEPVDTITNYMELSRS